MGWAVVILAPIVFVIVAIWMVLRLAVLMVRLFFLPVTLLLVLRR